MFLTFCVLFVLRINFNVFVFVVRDALIEILMKTPLGRKKEFCLDLMVLVLDDITISGLL